MRMYAILRSDPVLGLTRADWLSLLTCLVEQPCVGTIDQLAQSAHDRWHFSHYGGYSHLLLGGLVIEAAAVEAVIVAQAAALNITGTVEEKMAGVLEVELQKAATILLYPSGLFSVFMSATGEDAMSSTRAWLETNALIWSGAARDAWEKPTREAAYVGAQYIQINPTQYNVTTLADTGEGSLRAALEATGERDIHFSVAGDILFSYSINPPSGFLVDGSDAPAGGICFKNDTAFDGIQIDIQAAEGGHFKHIRFRPGLPSNGYNDYCKGLIIRNGASNIVVEHCSLSWGTDGVVGVGGQNVSFLYCVFSEGLAPNGALNKGILVQESAGWVVFDHCLFAHLGQRVPKFDTGTDVQFLNNVIYNCTSQTLFGSKSYPLFQRADVIANTWIDGVNLSRTYPPLDAWGSRLGSLLLYASGNQADRALYDNSATYISFEDAAMTIPDRSPTDAATALESVLAIAGACLPLRDSVDTRIVADVVNGTGAHIQTQEDVGGWPDLTT